MKILKVIIEDIALTLSSNLSYETKLDKIVAAAMPLTRVESKVENISEVILVHLAKVFQFPGVYEGWETEIANNMLNVLGRQKIKTNNKYPTRSQIRTWMRNIGNEESDMTVYLKTAVQQVQKDEGYKYCCLSPLSEQELLIQWMRFTQKFSDLYSPNKHWTAQDVTNLLRS